MISVYLDLDRCHSYDRVDVGKAALGLVGLCCASGHTGRDYLEHYTLIFSSNDISRSPVIVQAPIPPLVQKAPTRPACNTLAVCTLAPLRFTSASVQLKKVELTYTRFKV